MVTSPVNKISRLAAASILILVCATGSSPRAQSVAPIDRKITYILPQWFGFLSATNQQVADQVAILRARIGEGLRVKVGFTTYIAITMTNVNPANAAAVRAALASTFDQMDSAIARARANNIPICLSFATAIRATTDPLQLAAQAEDRRNIQWHSDQSLAAGWTTFSRYARKQEAIQQAFVRELGRGLAARMALYPDTLVAASGDGEVEMSYERSVDFGGAASEAASLIADYSPFAVAEFRDWLRGAGLYAPGQPFAGDAYALSARYAGDSSPSADTNGDGHTLASDFGTQAAFATWNLKHFDWSLADSSAPDLNAIPAAVYNGATFNPLAVQNAAGFAAPRTHARGSAWSDVWDLFRQTMVWRHNLEFAKWITTSADPASGATVPADRWFTDQIASDYLFTNVAILPSNPAGFMTAPTFRLDTSASPYWTADVTPYGSLGITSFNVNVGQVPNVTGDVYYRTLAAVAPRIAARGVRWGIFEWNPASPPKLSDPTIYDLEMALVEKYRPAILSPFEWSAGIPEQKILDTPFETALKNYVNRRNNARLTLNKSTLYAQTLTNGGARTPAQTVRVSGEPGESPSWNASSASAFVDIVRAPDGRSFTVELKPGSYAAGAQSATVVVTPTSTGYTSTTLTVNVTATAPAAATAPFGSFDTPADLQVVSGEVGITGWAVDDVGVKSIDLYRSPVAGEPANSLVFLGTASQVEGARPDIQGSFGTIPLSEKAGWGYMLLSNFLPNGGNGIFTLHALVTDVDGHTTNLGSRRIDCRNQSATIPFGTIDTPTQGQTVSGTFVNFGWVLTQNPRCIPADGSTIDVLIDGVAVGHPTYNNYRSDIAALFPGLCNTGTPGAGGAVGYFTIDTTTLTNGVHTIAWVARDTSGAATGLGSRYFTVANP
jgi:hypothetical protein